MTHARTPNRTPVPFLALIAALPAALLAGCDSEEISQNQAPNVSGETLKPATVASTSTGQTAGPQRMLGAVVPVADATWFFKLSGPAEDVAPHEIDFQRFIAALKFESGRPVWQLPTGWAERGPSEMRVNTLTIPTGTAPLELTVTTLRGDGGGLLANINRWRGQVGLEPVNEQALGQITRPVQLAGNLTATVVDFTGSGGTGAMVPPFAGGPPPSAPPTAAAVESTASAAAGQQVTAGPLTFRVPASWQPGRPSSFRVASFAVIDGERVLDISVIPLGLGSGSTLDNVNRWLAEIAMPPVTAEQLPNVVSDTTVGGKAGYLANLRGSAQSGQSTLAVAVEHGEQVWFFKARGPTDLLDAQAANFNAFLQSVKFNDAGAN